jgi:hypothetical protein
MWALSRTSSGEVIVFGETSEARLRMAESLASGSRLFPLVSS